MKILFLILFSLTSFKASAKNCTVLFDSQNNLIWNGEHVGINSLPFTFMPFQIVEKANKLGEGSLGGKVYRLKFDDGKTRTLKWYEYLSSNLSDISKMKFLKIYKARIPFRIAKYNRVSLKTIEVENVFGIPISKLDASSPVENDILRKYSNSIEKLSSEQIPQTSDVITMYDGYNDLPQIKFKTPHGTIWIHPANVIYEPSTGDLVIIDPS